MEEEKKKKEEFQREQLRKKIISEELSRSVNSVTINTGLKKPKKSILDIINPASNYIFNFRKFDRNFKTPCRENCFFI